MLGYASKRRENHEPPLLRTHFALSGAGINLPPVVQWADCMNACLFLISLVGGDAREVGEAAPSQQATEVLNRCHAVGFNGQARPPDLAKGHGASTTQVLDFLSRKAMDAINIEPPDYSQVDKVEDANDESDEDGDIQEDCGSYVEDDVLDEEYVVAEDSKFCEVDENEDRAILQARTSVNEWKVELERVGPKLSSSKPKDSWRRRVLLTKVNVSKRQDMDKHYGITVNKLQSEFRKFMAPIVCRTIFDE